LGGSDLDLNYSIDFVAEIIIIVRAASRRHLNRSIKSVRRAFAVSDSSLRINLINFFLRGGVDDGLLYTS
jgi:hypothetical protein